MQPRRNRDREPRHVEQMPDRGQRLGRDPARQLRERGRLRRDRARDLEREDKEAEPDPEREARRGLDQERIEPEADPCRRVGADGRKDHRGEAEREHEAHAHRHRSLAKAGDDRHHRADPHEHEHEPRPERRDGRLERDRKVDERVQAGTTPMSAGRASVPISS